METKDCVVLDIKTYDRLKKASTKNDVVVDRLFDALYIGGNDNISLSLHNSEIVDILRLVYPERFKNKISDLKEK